MSPRNSAEEAQRTRTAILAQGVVRASIEGLEGMTIGTLAEDLGLSKAGVVGPFGSKQALQLAVLAEANGVFTEQVWRPVADRPAGRERLQAVCNQWVDFLQDCPLPGGCFISTASMEWDSRPGPLRDAVAAAQGRWLKTLRADAEVAVRAGELPADTDPTQLAFEINATAMGLNQAVQLFGDTEAPDRARRTFARLLAPCEATR
jgi:AcrR family transcriptional regulator